MPSVQFEQLGPYRIERTLGKGGMGLVFAGVETTTGEAAAVKVLSAALGREEGFRERFFAEVESLRKLNHPNIVRLQGYGEQDGVHFYAMELVEGRTLADELTAGRKFTYEEVIDVGLQMCRALKHAHDRGVIHRDIKPANLLLAPGGVVKLSDFGIAKLFGNTRLTMDGGVLGTAEFMAPEQADGRPVTHRCDLYSLGGVMYTLLAGRPPFLAKTLPEMLQLQRFAEPDPLSRVSRDTPEELAETVHMLLSKDPEKRSPTALVLMRRLEALRHGLASKAGIIPLKLSNGDSEHGSANASAGVEDAVTAYDPLKNKTGIQASPSLTTAYPLAPQDSAKGSSPDALKGATLDHATGLNRPSSGSAWGGKYTPVAKEEDPDWVDDDDESPIWISPATWSLLGGLVAVGMIAWYMLQPPSADRLYSRISASAKNEDLDVLADSKHDVDMFLSEYSQDPRSTEVERLQTEIDNYEKQRRLLARLRLRQKTNERLPPVDREFIGAIGDLKDNPLLARKKFGALVDLYNQGMEDLPKSSQDCLENAAWQIRNLDQRLATREQSEVSFLKKQVQRLTELEAKSPDEARAAWKGFIFLYEDRPWAEPYVKQARQALERLGEGSAALPPSDP